MSDATQIFIATDDTSESVVNTISKVLGDQFQRAQGRGELASWESPEFFVDLHQSNGLIDDEDLPFTQYPYFLAVRARQSVYTTDSDGEKTFARQIFYRLTQLNRYSLMLVANLQQRLDSYELSSAQQLA